MPLFFQYFTLLLPPGHFVSFASSEFMFRVSERIARLEGAKAIVTGESLGQVASQTLDNIAAVNEVVDLPVLRPLIGSDKQEIIRRAQAIGTYDISCQTAPDCCTLFMIDTQLSTLSALLGGSGHVSRDMVEANVARTAEVKPCSMGCRAGTP